MGRGDQRTGRGKIFARSYGKRRPRKSNKSKIQAPREQQL